MKQTSSSLKDTISRIMKPESNVDTSQVKGNVSPEVKHALLSSLVQPSHALRSTGKPFRGFKAEFVSRMQLAEASVLSKAEEPEQLEGRTVFEVIVDEDMFNDFGTMHGGCLAMIIDICSSMPVYVLGASTSAYGVFGIQQSLNIVYHSPAVQGDKLRIVSTTLTLGSRACPGRCEVWNVTRHRLVASAVHTNMVPSKPKVSESAKL
ncbi:HotDog domain-containing protein [Suillus clintonianus]|uniref:HotDog domain-containing protein n=1 Tax=Suillus clintonianus TaxID=1904413 RepID=UPI001B87ABAC|nr:HotDog domain-containing protein [Suillus clintonianus]KAG2143627.1 HotDog domain-containing protein [Suillus clintonianus]